MAYTPDPTDRNNPLDSEQASTASSEFRALKGYLQDQLATLNASITALQAVVNKSIQVFTGPVTAIPTGWQLADGTNGTYDLRGKFLLGSDVGAGTPKYALNTAGGEEKHTLTVDEMPAHNHTDGLHTNLLRPPYSGSLTGSDFNGSGSEQAVGSGDSAAMTVVGAGLPHNNMPPYYALAFIQCPAS